MHPFLTRLQAIVPPDNWSSVEQSFYETKQISLRLNTLKCHDIDSLRAQLDCPLTPGPWLNTLVTEAKYRDTLTYSQAFTDGLFYIQNLSSMLPALELNLSPGLEILDLCAAPGSKTSQLAMLINNNGHIAAVERSKPRFFKLKDNLARQGVNCVKAFCRDGKTVYRHCAEKFDRVLIDAPCSGEARFDLNNQHTLDNWSEKAIKKLAREQWQLLYSGFMSLKPGGTLIYSTCTTAPEENEGVMNKLIKKFGDQAQLQLLDNLPKNYQPGLTSWQGKTFNDDMTLTARILPTHQFDAFFIAKVKKISAS